MNELRIGPESFIEQCTTNGHFTKVCNARWNDADASVACRTSGYCDDAESCHQAARSYDFVLAKSVVKTVTLKCNGYEEDLNRCGHEPPNILDNCNDMGFRVLCADQGIVLCMPCYPSTIPRVLELMHGGRD